MRDLVVEPVVDGVWCIRRRSYMTCSYALAQDDGIVLIDTGMDSNALDVSVALEAANADWSDISQVILTHWHNDHAAGGAETQARSGATVWCGRDEVPYVTRQTRRGGMIGRLGDAWPEQGPLVLAKGLLTDAPRRAVMNPEVATDGAQLGGLQVIATPGHTPGHVSVWDPQRRMLFAGDALAVVRDRIRHMARSVTPDQPEAKRSMATLLDLDPAWICPGHRRPLRTTPELVAEARANVEQTRWPLFG